MMYYSLLILLLLLLYLQPLVESKNDFCDNVDGWEDNDGYDCKWYEKQKGDGKNTRCEEWSSCCFNMGHSAATACCACGGGTYYDYCHDLEGDNGKLWEDSEGRKCDWYEIATMDPIEGVEFHKYDTRCYYYGEAFENQGYTAQEACCACGGGLNGAPSAAPSKSPAPTRHPTKKPTRSPTVEPSAKPTISPKPTASPTASPSSHPTRSFSPTSSPTSSPTESPSTSPTFSMPPSMIPTSSLMPTSISTVFLSPFDISLSLDTRSASVDVEEMAERTQDYLLQFLKARMLQDGYSVKDVTLITSYFGIVSQEKATNILINNNNSNNGRRRELDDHASDEESLSSTLVAVVKYNGYALFSGKVPVRSNLDLLMSRAFDSTLSPDYISYLKQSTDPELASASSSKVIVYANQLVPAPAPGGGSITKDNHNNSSSATAYVTSALMGVALALAMSAFILVFYRIYRRQVDEKEKINSTMDTQFFEEEYHVNRPVDDGDDFIATHDREFNRVWNDLDGYTDAQSTTFTTTDISKVSFPQSHGSGTYEYIKDLPDGRSVISAESSKHSEFSFNNSKHNHTHHDYHDGDDEFRNLRKELDLITKKNSLLLSDPDMSNMLQAYKNEYQDEEDTLGVDAGEHT